MLQYMRARQLPRKYVIPEAHTIPSPPKHPCDICCTRVWTPESFSIVSSAPREQERVSVRYQITSEELRKSVLGGCKFCKTLADGIHGRVFLDELYERLQVSHISPGSDVSGDDVESGEASSEAVNEESQDAESEWNDASVFNEEEIDNDITGGWNAWQDRDMLAEACLFSVDISFERGDAGLFTFVNVRIEAVDDTDEMNELQKLRSDRVVELRYHINSEDNGSSTVSLFPTATINSMLGAEANMKMLQAWMRSLAPVPVSTSSDYLPARLIQLCDEHNLRVVNTAAIQGEEKTFAALSYVWGADQPLKLLSTTTDLLTTGFEVGRLPQTIQDAVTVTRRIGLEYIWVDALCIMQDSDADKAVELPKMRSIYKWAAVTLVASVAKSATEGFLDHVEEKYNYFIEPVILPFSANAASTAPAKIVLSYPSSYERWKDPINSRAWTFQELILSTRAILFSYRGVQTIDRTNPTSANGESSGKDPQLPSLPWNSNLLSLATDPENTRQVWLALRGEYSRRNLSYQGDKLVAISAVADELGQTYNSRYLAGLWERDLAMDLHWRCPRDDTLNEEGEYRKPRAKDYVAPSWSWASVDGAVEDFVQVWEDEGSDGGVGYKDSFGLEVISCNVELAITGFDYGAVTSGVLVVRGRLCTLIWRPYPRDDHHNNLDSDGHLMRPVSGNKSDPLHTEINCGEATLDALDPDMHDGAEVVCLGGRLMENVPGRDDVEGMMLLRTMDGHYRRVGFFRVEVATFADCGTESVTIM